MTKTTEKRSSQFSSPKQHQKTRTREEGGKQRNEEEEEENLFAHLENNVRIAANNVSYGEIDPSEDVDSEQTHQILHFFFQTPQLISPKL